MGKNKVITLLDINNIKHSIIIHTGLILLLGARIYDEILR